MTKNTKKTEGKPRVKMYYYIDVDINSRQIIGWGTEERGEVEVTLSSGFHRLFVSVGQYNKLVGQLEKRS